MKTPFSIFDRDLNLDLPVNGSLVYCKSSALDDVATEAACRRMDFWETRPQTIWESAEATLVNKWSAVELVKHLSPDTNISEESKHRWSCGLRHYSRSRLDCR
uniref:(California timema) hypothetical protein n=1 Tax=Timema californicum TaxID=61474 RepID=A0A7R9J2M5_TIMCA|nr:unnamed protein product [Timema californicum]